MSRLPTVVALGCLAACSSPSSSQESVASHAATARPEAGAPSPRSAPGAPLVFSPQPGWIAEEPSTSMRKAQYRLPGAGAETGSAELVVYFFAGGGGSIDANVERWCGQFDQPDGRPSADVLTRSERQVGGLSVHEVDLRGTYVAETAPGSGQHVNQPGWRMLASIVESDHGPYYVKLVGPEATVGRWEASYRRFVGEIRPAGD